MNAQAQYQTIGCNALQHVGCWMSDKLDALVDAGNTFTLAALAQGIAQDKSIAELSTVH
jgi:hypothetical protein